MAESLDDSYTHLEEEIINLPDHEIGRFQCLLER